MKFAMIFQIFMLIIVPDGGCFRRVDVVFIVSINCDTCLGLWVAKGAGLGKGRGWWFMGKMGQFISNIGQD
jgi:hypothetical protein